MLSSIYFSLSSASGMPINTASLSISGLVMFTIRWVQQLPQSVQLTAALTSVFSLCARASSSAPSYFLSDRIKWSFSSSFPAAISAITCRLVSYTFATRRYILISCKGMLLHPLCLISAVFTGTYVCLLAKVVSKAQREHLCGILHICIACHPVIPQYRPVTIHGKRVFCR